MKNFAILLTVLFVGLKIAGIISWSWIFVLSPLLIWILIVVFLLFVLGICAYLGKKF